MYGVFFVKNSGDDQSEYKSRSQRDGYAQSTLDTPMRKIAGLEAVFSDANRDHDNRKYSSVKTSIQNQGPRGTSIPSGKK
jgi:hypothetical protein